MISRIMKVFGKSFRKILDKTFLYVIDYKNQ